MRHWFTIYVHNMPDDAIQVHLDDTLFLTFLSSLSVRARKAIRKQMDFVDATLRQVPLTEIPRKWEILLSTTADDLLCRKNVGRYTLDEIRESLRSIGLHLRDDASWIDKSTSSLFPAKPPESSRP